MPARPSHLAWLAGAVFTMSLFVWQWGDPGCTAQAAQTVPTDFCYRTPVSVTNTSGSSKTDYPVRFVFPASSLIASDKLGPQLWDLRPVNSGNTEIEVLAQGIDLDTKGWWLRAPSLPNGTTVTHFLYSGNQEFGRDQCVSFFGSDVITVPSHADFDVTDELAIEVRMTPISTTAQDATLASRSSTTTGYALSLFDDAGTQKVRAQVNATTLDYTWSILSEDLGVVVTWRMEYDSAGSPQLRILKDGTQVASSSPGIGAITSASSTDVTIGEDLADADICEVAIEDGINSARAPVARYGFDPALMDESTWADPTATGTVEDEISNTHPATYTFTRSQTGISATVGTLELTSSPSRITYNPEVIDVLGPPLVTDITVKGPQKTRFPFAATFATWAEMDIDGDGASDLPEEFVYASLATMLGVITMSLMLAMLPQLPVLGVGGFFVFVGGGAMAGLYTPWYPLMWLMILLFAAMALKALSR